MTYRAILDYLLAQFRAWPELDALGVGGGYGRGDEDALSDLDLFLVVPDPEL